MVGRTSERPLVSLSLFTTRPTDLKWFRCAWSSCHHTFPVRNFHHRHVWSVSRCELRHTTVPSLSFSLIKEQFQHKLPVDFFAFFGLLWLAILTKCLSQKTVVSNFLNWLDCLICLGPEHDIYCRLDKWLRWTVTVFRDSTSPLSESIMVGTHTLNHFSAILTGHVQDAFKAVVLPHNPASFGAVKMSLVGKNTGWFGWTPVVSQAYIPSIEGLPGILPWRIRFHLAQCVRCLNGSVPPERLKNGWLRSRSKELLQSSCTVKLILIKIDYSIWDTWVINF